jgi:nucleotide-binding universal stress UspA family protein
LGAPSFQGFLYFLLTPFPPAGKQTALEDRKMPRILVALDGSHGSEKALDAAVKVAQTDGGLVTAVAVLEQTGIPRLDQLPEDAKAQARSHLDELLQAAAHFATSRGVRLTPILREGHPADVILTCAEEEKSSLLVLGAGGEPGGKTGLGDTADLVSNHSPCTVLIVR